MRPEAERELAHRSILFYASLSASFPHGFVQRPARFSGRRAELEQQLLPMLRRNAPAPILEDLVAESSTFIEDWVLPRTDGEREYLERFAAGDFDPSLLFPDVEMADAALASPEAQWKLKNLRAM